MILKIADVKAGDELVCIGGVLVKGSTYEVSEIKGNCFRLKDDPALWSDQALGFFKKKEQSQQYTFDDLINMSTKAVKDRLFVSIKTDFKSIIALWGVGDEEAQTVFHNGKHNQVNCEYIQRLYKETFVIETEEDISRVKGDASITFANGNKTTAVSGIKIDGKNTIQITHLKKPLGLFFLKGAIVEQDRGRNE